MKNLESTTHGEGTANAPGHLLPPFYAANNERPQNAYPSEASPTGEYHKSAARQGINAPVHDSHRIASYGEGQRDSYRNLGDRRWQRSENSSWQPEGVPHQGYRSMSERMEGAHGHTGKGPRSYRRSDGRIIEDINDRMYDDPWLDASGIETSAKEGEVILTGTVSDRSAKRRAEDIAESVRGVTHVENRLRINQAGEQVNHSNG